MKREDHLNVDEAKEYVEEYCGPTPEAEAQAKEAAWVLYQELQKCKAENEEKEPDEEETIEEKKPKAKHKEVGATPTEIKLPVQAKLGKRSYKQFVQDQMKVIGTAGMIAMSTAVYSQSQAVYTQGAIVYNIVEKELPILGYLKGLLTGTVPFSVSDVVTNSVTSYQNATAKDSTPTAATKTATIAAESVVVKGEKTLADTAAVDPSTPEVKSLLEEGKRLADQYDDTLLLAPPTIESPVPPVINPPATTNPNP